MNRETPSENYEQNESSNEALEKLQTQETASSDNMYEKVSYQLSKQLSERRLHKNRLRLWESVVMNARDAILITDTESVDNPNSPTVVFVNKAFTEMTGYSPNEIVGKTPRILQGEKTDKVELAKLRQALENWQPIRVELINYKKDGSAFWIDFQVFPITDEQGWYTHWVAIQRDITERKEAEAKMQQAKNMAESANQAKNSFLANISHELRTPLNSILGYAQILEQDNSLTEKQHSAICMMRRSGDHLLTLINDILDMAKIEAGRFSLLLADFVFKDLINEINDMFKIEALRCNVEFETIIAPEIPDIVHGDIKRLRQVLLNLLDNAIKYTQLIKGRQRKVTFKVQYQINRAYFEVRDTGIGIPSDQINKIFEKFEQFGNSAQPLGTGLGLAICQGLLQVMGGDLYVESIIDRGSCFWFSIPLPCTQLKARETPHPLVTKEKEVIVSYQRIDDNPCSLKLLVVDDYQDNRQLIKDILHPFGFEVLLATQGLEALQILRAQKVDALITDIRMPVMTGIELLEKLAIENLLPPTVFITSAGSYESEHLKEVPHNALLTKPINVAQMLKTLEQHLPFKWQYKRISVVNAETANSKFAHDFSIPPLHVIEDLLAEIRKGKIKEILDYIHTLDKTLYGDFVEHANVLAHNFEINKLRDLLESIKNSQ